ncbi:MAG: hypothetical protein ABTQ32_04930, partial [Myxococcaceae bacterium]
SNVGGGTSNVGGGTSNVGGGTTNVGGGTTNVGGGTTNGGGTANVGGGTAPDCRGGVPCGANASCDFQTGQCVCDAGRRSCAGACVVCPTAGVATTTCNGSVCVAETCAPGQRVCGGACTSCPANATATACDTQNRCIATACSPGSRACGGTCATCPAGAATTTCGGANQLACVPLTCVATTNLCSEQCVPDSDPLRCGAGCQTCAAETAGSTTGTWAPVCRSGVCGQGCAPGESLCKGVCATGSCVWSTTTLTASTTKFAVGSRENITTREGFLVFQKPDPSTVGSPTRTFVHSFTRTSAVQAPTGTGYQSAVDGQGLLDLSLSMSSGIFTFGLPRSPVVGGMTNREYLVWTCGSTSCSVSTRSNPALVDSTETGIVVVSQSVSSSLPWRLMHDNEDCCGLSSPPTAVWNVSTPTTKRIAWLSGSTLQLATKGTSSWTTAVVSSLPPQVTLLRASPNGSLANLEQTATGLEVRFQASSWSAVTLPLPSGAVWKAKYDFNGVFRVVSSHSSTGTVLSTLQGNRFTSEQVAAQAFSNVDFTVLPDDQAVVVGAGASVSIFR